MSAGCRMAILCLLNCKMMVLVHGKWL
uniref:Uncharacterized protein n=1 Tax=Arundo donax TaxID=35708 RepID=A0A0A9QDZ7_ARUDO